MIYQAGSKVLFKKKIGIHVQKAVLLVSSADIIPKVSNFLPPLLILGKTGLTRGKIRRLIRVK